ncbi:tetratricopeptide repeat protein, partial [Salmonella sp. SAL4444]|uniref:tetratricopeptide repeat protein n=1 Tax=Salmonella sp. SAL4444 TaxID=3159899 RepID=UPI00397B74FC
AGLYGNGQGVARDYDEALRWLRKSAAQEHGAALKEIGRCYENGWGVTQNLTEAVEWYRKAAAHGNAWGQFNLGLLHHTGKG